MRDATAVRHGPAVRHSAASPVTPDVAILRFQFLRGNHQLLFFLKLPIIVYMATVLPRCLP